MRLTYRILTAVALLALAVVPVAWAANPAAGTVSKNQDAAWTGGPFTISNPAACATSVDPLCDHFLLTVNAKAGTRVAVAITTAAPATNDFDLFVYAPDGTLLTSSASSGGTETAVFEHQLQWAGQAYEVRVQPWLVEPGTTYQGVAATTKEPIDVVRECLEPVPASVSTNFLLNVELKTMVLLDGVTRERAQQVMSTAASSYAPLNISLTWRFRDVAFATDDADALIQGAKDLFGGKRPKNFDLVYVMTTKDIQLGGDTAVAGLADCIGGVRYPETAFAVGEDFGAAEDAGRPLGPFVHTVNGSSIVVAHELGHLMGGHHHYGNCVEGITLLDLLKLELTPCTLMFNAVNFASLPFSTLNSTVVRGHALDYATP
jgi:reprolysin-like metallo-peptidase family M12B